MMEEKLWESVLQLAGTESFMTGIASWQFRCFSVSKFMVYGRFEKKIDFVNIDSFWDILNIAGEDLKC